MLALFLLIAVFIFLIGALFWGAVSLLGDVFHALWDLIVRTICALWGLIDRISYALTSRKRRKDAERDAMWLERDRQVVCGPIRSLAKAANSYDRSLQRYRGRICQAQQHGSAIHRETLKLAERDISETARDWARTHQRIKDRLREAERVFPNKLYEASGVLEDRELLVKKTNEVVQLERELTNLISHDRIPTLPDHTYQAACVQEMKEKVQFKMKAVTPRSIDHLQGDKTDAKQLR